MTENEFCGQNVLEVACGTGFWTQYIAKGANSIHATDYSPEVIEIAQQKKYGLCPVKFCHSDAYSLSEISGPFSAGFSGFWWSHIPKARISEFLKVFHSRLDKGSLVVFIDNSYVEGSSTPIFRKDSDGNTYQIRRLDDGSEHGVLKNFPTDQELRESVSTINENVDIIRLEYYWFLKYIKK